MPVEFVTIPKNGSTFLRTLNQFISCDLDLSIVVLRHPTQRFWSATKEVHPLTNHLSLYKEMIDDCVKILRGETKFSTTAVDVYLNDAGIKHVAISHLKPQSIFIGEKKFDYVFRLENLTADLNTLIDKGIIQTSRNIEDLINVKLSNHSRDSDAIQYLDETYMSFLSWYYKDDYSVYNDFNRLLKVNYGSSN